MNRTHHNVGTASQFSRPSRLSRVTGSSLLALILASVGLVRGTSLAQSTAPSPTDRKSPLQPGVKPVAPSAAQPPVMPVMPVMPVGQQGQLPASTPAVQPAAATAGTVPAAIVTGAAPAATTGVPQRDTLIRMQRSIQITFNETRLEDVMKFIAEVTRADIETMWADDQNSSGLDKEKTISIKQDKGTSLNLLEKVLEKATSDLTGATGNTWQLTENGTLQVGPRERLNKFRRVELYSVRDLLMEIPNYDGAPEFDLQSVLQNQGGGGGGQSPFRENQEDDNNSGVKPFTERVTELEGLLTELVEPEQWTNNGGDAATIRFYQNTFIINAPDYVHRQINGYPYWSARATKVAMVNKRRYVTLGIDTAISQLSGIENQAVTGPK